MFEQATLSFAELSLDLDNIWRNTGNDGYTPDPESQQIFDSIVRELAQVCRPQYGYALFPSEGIDKKAIRMGGESLHTGPVISRYLSQAKEFAIFIATAGAHFETMRYRIEAEGDIMKQFLLDMLGTEIAEAAGRIMAEKLSEAQAVRKYHISNSYSPGYCGWNITDQHTLFSLLPQAPCGITLTPSSLMLPIKSVSGVIALGPEVIKAPYGCAICGKSDCYKNRLRKKI